LLELRGVAKSFHGTLAVHVPELTAAAGETVALIGASGSGKSTILRMVVGLVRADRGTIRLDGEEVTPPRLPAIRRRLGYVIQEGGLFPHLNARDNVAIMAKHSSWSESDIETRLAELAELTHFPVDGWTRFPSQLSGGQRQRVSLMRALMLSPAVLLLDEPLGALDPLIRADLQTDLRRIFRSLGQTVLLVTHDLPEARYFADRLVLLHEGEVVQTGTFDDLASRPATPFVTRFVRAHRTLSSGDPDEA
jgi:osmoprotectant transport system ATP-binding protein